MGGHLCSGNLPCCSATGFCGADPSFCGEGCQEKFSLAGACTGAAASASSGSSYRRFKRNIYRF